MTRQELEHIIRAAADLTNENVRVAQECSPLEHK